MLRFIKKKKENKTDQAWRCYATTFRVLCIFQYKSSDSQVQPDMAWHQLGWELGRDRMDTLLCFAIPLARKMMVKPTGKCLTLPKSAFDSKDSFLIQMFYLNDLPLLFYFTLTTLKCSGTEASFTKFRKTRHSFFWDWNTHIYVPSECPQCAFGSEELKAEVLSGSSK